MLKTILKSLLLLTSITTCFSSNLSALQRAELCGTAEMNDESNIAISQSSSLAKENSHVFTEQDYIKIINEIMDIKPDISIKILTHLIFMLIFIYVQKEDYCYKMATKKDLLEILYPIILSAAYYDKKMLVHKVYYLKNKILNASNKSNLNQEQFEFLKIIKTFFLDKDFAKISAHSNTFNNFYCEFLRYLIICLVTIDLSHVYEFQSYCIPYGKDLFKRLSKNFACYCLYSKIVMGPSSINSDLESIASFLRKDFKD